MLHKFRSTFENRGVQGQSSSQEIALNSYLNFSIAFQIFE